MRVNRRASRVLRSATSANMTAMENETASEGTTSWRYKSARARTHDVSTAAPRAVAMWIRGMESGVRYALRPD